jgi:hypothetical protein
MYGMLVRMEYEALSGYTCNVELYAREWKKFKNTLLSILDKHLDQNHHIYELVKTLSDKKIRVCGIMRVNRGILHDLQRKLNI